jgi:type IV secretory pathway VirB2 component (pilin)
MQADWAPTSGNAIVNAVGWIQGTLLGTVGTVVAILAVAGVGYGMLWGRVNLRRGATVILGCFILFGAPVLAAGIRAAVVGEASGDYPVVARSAVPTPVAAPAPAPVPTPPPRQADPFAGAAVPSAPIR